jgi:quinol monooxygenase YgiN
MYMRFVHLKVKEGKMREMIQLYEERVIPTLQETRGCIYASLLRPSGDDLECVSMTMWRNQELADAYETSGTYDEILDASDELLAEVSTGRVRSSGEAPEEVPVLQDPEVEAYPVEVAGFRDVVDAVGPHQFFVRIVSARVERGKFEELKERFNEEIKPALLATKGCRAVFLVENVKQRSRALSVTIWDSEEEAIRHELSGAFDDMVARVSEFFSGLYQWKLSLGTEEGRDEVRGKDLDIRGFRVVTGRRLGG